MLIDLHAHSSGISRCCKIGFEGGILRAREVGVDGFVLTNHYTASYVDGEDMLPFAKEYVEEFFRAEAYGKTLNFPVFFGIEVTAELYEGVHLLIYGVPPEFLLQNPRLCFDTQEELYEKVHRAGGILIQAHPYRKTPRLMNLRYLDGVEISCHPHLSYGGSFAPEMLEVARENGKILTCGGDYHADVKYRPQCGLFVPDFVEDGIALKEWLVSAEETVLRVHEPGGGIQDMTYTRRDDKT